MSAATWSAARVPEVQRLALTGYDSDCARHFVLTVIDDAQARRYLAGLLHDGLLTFGSGDRQAASVNVGFTYRGLGKLGVPRQHLRVLKDKSPAFAEGARLRAPRLGDAGDSAVERWDAPFASDDAHVWIAVHANHKTALEAMVLRLRTRSGADLAFTGWDAEGLSAHHFPDPPKDPATGKKIRYVHFGLRDNIARPVIDARGGEPHAAGELLLGYPNDSGFSLWSDQDTPEAAATFLRNASFGVLRKVAQHEGRLDDYLHKQVTALQGTHAWISADFLKAKMSGRWPGGAVVRPEDRVQPPDPMQVNPVFDPLADADGFGCPFGAHIRRANPRTDPVQPKRARTLFRRGMPYGPKYDPQHSPQTRDADRGLMGVFFCASIEDQFELVVSEWIEKNPMGPRTGGRAKDPLVGRHDEPDARFHIPLKDEPAINLDGFTPFVSTRGMLYALFPGRWALDAMTSLYGGERRATGTRAAAPPEETMPTPDPDAVDAGEAPADRYCDIVMEGGVTSGIIYATAVATLSRQYRFKNIGGSSIGAFAAALTAAAEYQRRKGSAAGFDTLKTLPDELAVEDKGRTLLQRLFVPQEGTRRLFQIFLATLERGSGMTRVLAGAWAALRQYRRLAALVSLVLLAVVLAGPLLSVLWASEGDLWTAGILLLAWFTAAALTLGVSVVAAVLAGVVWDFARHVVPNGFGLCRGWPDDVSVQSLDLAGFLHASIQRVAGRKIDDLPLTFRDLWNAPGAPSGTLQDPRGGAARSINLEVYSSNLAHGRPYRFPLDDPSLPGQNEDMGRLFFCPKELERYFPAALVRYLVMTSRLYAPASEADPPADPDKQQLRELPAADLPIVVAARLAMSFPLLISAVPLWAIDHEPKDRKDRTLARCWMSDGGLCSNFPIHLFDSAVPRWPTFGISLNRRSEARPKQAVWLPERYHRGRGDTWDHRAVNGKTALERLGGFLISLWVTTWHWNDSTMMRMPGVRDRVVRVYLEPEEGGVNIRMPGDKIRALAKDYGEPAARAFIEKFADPGSLGWAEHRWVRFNSLLVALRKRVEGLQQAAETNHHTVPLATQIKRATGQAPLRGAPYRKPWPSTVPLCGCQQQELQDLLAALYRLERAFATAGDTQPFIAVPRPSLRVRHPT